MSIITKEKLIESLQRRISFASGFPESEKAQIDLEIARIALASLEAEPVAWDHEWASCITCDGPQNFERIVEHEAPPEWAIKSGQARNLIPLYTAPPAPVSVPDAMEMDDDFDSAFEHGKAVGWNAYRAAMLQAGNSPVTPDCSCRTCRPVTFTDSRFVVCPECGNKRCPHANDHRNACTGSNAPGQEGSAYPAAPQQEAKP